ncbi:MAG: DUF3822 family protein [Chitinophagales bacterium]|nr:DUF3822 family protein [Chitinophagales bacterium]
MDNAVLQIYLSEHVCIVAIVDASINKLVEIKYFFYTTMGEISAALSSVLMVDFKQVKVCFQTEQFVLLPNETANAKYIFSQLGIDVANDASILSNEISNKHIYYIVPNDIIAFFDNRFKAIQWLYGQTGLINRKNQSINKKIVNIYIEQSILGIAIKEQSDILFFNLYNIIEKEDVLYYIQLVFKQLALDNETQVINVYGFIEEQSPIYTLLYDYFRQIEIDRTIKRTANLLFNDDEQTLNYFVNLLFV